MWEEHRALSELRFRFAERLPPLTAAQSLAHAMHDYADRCADMAMIVHAESVSPRAGHRELLQGPAMQQPLLCICCTSASQLPSRSCSRLRAGASVVDPDPALQQKQHLTRLRLALLVRLQARGDYTPAHFCQTGAGPRMLQGSPAGDAQRAAGL